MRSRRPASGVITVAAMVVVPVAVVASSRSAGAAPHMDGGREDAGSGLSVVVAGELSAAKAVVGVSAARVVLHATPQRQGGITVGVASWDEVEASLEVHNRLGVGARSVEVELTLGRELPDGLHEPRRGRTGTGSEADDERPGAPAKGAPLVSMAPITGWKFRLLLEAAPGDGKPTTVRGRFPLPPLEEAVRPSSPAEIRFAVKVVGYHAPRLALDRAVAVLRAGTAEDARAIFLGYGEQLSGDARAFDEQLLLGMLGIQPSREGREIQRVAAREAAPRRANAPAVTSAAAAGPSHTPLEFAFLLRACRRIGGQPTLEGLIMNEEPLGGRAPPLPERLDEAHPPDNIDLLPAASFAAAIHETIVEVARHNLAGLYLLLHAPPPAPPELVVEAARQLADAERLDEPMSWLEAAAAIPRDVPQYDPDTDREGRLPIIPVLARYGGPEVLPVLVRALAADDLPLRDEAARALARRGEPGVRALLDALDTEDDARRAPVSGALAALDGEGRSLLGRLASARGVVVEAGQGAGEIVAALEEQLAGARVRRVGEQLDRAEALAGRDAASPEIGRLLAQARETSPRAFTEARERVAKVAALVYRARAAAGVANARAILDETARLGPIAGAEFAAALRDARIAEARARAATDLEGALRLLDGGDAESRAVAQELVLTALDGALERRDRVAAAALLGRARELGATGPVLEPRMARLRRIELLPWAAAGLALVLVTGGALLTLRLRLRRR